MAKKNAKTKDAAPVVAQAAGQESAGKPKPIEPVTWAPMKAEPDPDEEGLTDLADDRLSYYRHYTWKCGYGHVNKVENARAGDRLQCSSKTANGETCPGWGHMVRPRTPEYATDVNTLPEGINLPGGLAMAFNTGRSLFARRFNEPLDTVGASAVGHAFAVLIDHNRMLAERVRELEHHLDLVRRDLGRQVNEARGLEAALTRINNAVRLPARPHDAEDDGV